VHIRCHQDDVTAAVKSGVDAVNVYMATSDALRAHSHKKSIAEVIETAVQVVQFALEHNVEVRFSCEDAFRSNLDDILEVYRALVDVGVHRVGLADTVGVATPEQVRVSRPLRPLLAYLPRSCISQCSSA
jgi:homocitrate synthase